jgi:hypothetical protein
MDRCLRLLMVLSFGALSLVGVAAASAQDASPEAETGGIPSGCTVVASGLNNPRFVALGADGTLYVTEAGNGGDEVMEMPGATPVEGGEEAGPPPTRGFTGQVSAIAPDGTQSVIADGLPSYGEGVGPTGIVVGDGVLWISTGGGAVAAGIEPLENEDSILSIDLATGDVTQIAELGSYEADNNPDGTDVNPNLYAMDIGADGQLYVNDAGGNTIYKVDPTTGDFALLGIVPAPELPEQPADATPVADEETEGPPQPVPTGLDIGADGNLYIVTLGAFIPGASTVFIAQADGTFVQVATGLSVGIGVTLGPDGALYVSQLASLTGEQPGPGNVVRIAADGSFETVVDGIAFPHGMAFDAEGNLYVVANSTTFGPPPSEPDGQVLRCDGIAAS